MARFVLLTDDSCQMAFEKVVRMITAPVIRPER